MLARIKIFLFLFALQWSSSWLIPLEKTDALSSSSANNSEVLESIEKIAPINTINTEMIQQIDVKDDEDQVTSNINQVVIGNVANDAIKINGRTNNGTNTIPGLHNQLANETKTEVNNNSSIETDPPNNTNHADSNPVENPVNDEDISNAEAPAFRSLIPEKENQVNDVLTESPKTVDHNLKLEQGTKEAKDHNLVLNLSPITPPLIIDLNQLPFNNLLEGALGFMKRFKRNADSNQPLKENCKSTTIEEFRSEKTFMQARNSFSDVNSNNLRAAKPIARICALSIMAKVATTQVLNRIVHDYPDGLLTQIITSFRNGKEDTINLFTEELPGLPIPIQFRLQIIHGKTKEFLKRSRAYVDEKLCSLPMS